jgi:pimeloyl-ACP methyl ester carboxylesterase
MQFIERFVTLNGLRFRYLESANAKDQPTLVCYHATGFVSELWLPVLRELGDAYHYLALDQRGHGRSDKTASEHTWYHTALDFQHFAQALDLRDAIGLGHSSGATSIAVTAVREPGRIARAMLIEPTIRPRAGLTNTQPSPFIERTRKRRARWANHAELKATLGSRPPYNTWTAEMLDLFAHHATAPTANGEIELCCAPDVEADIYASFPAFDPWPELPQLRVPILLMHGTGPSLMGTTRVEEIMPVWPRAQLVEIPEGGHLVLMEAPHKIAAAIREFLQ